MVVLPSPVRHKVVDIEREPRYGEEHHHQEEHLDCPPPRGQPSYLLLLRGSPNMASTPEVVGDEGVGHHGDQEWYEELYEEHAERHPGSSTRGEGEL